MSTEYLDKTGLTYFWSKIKNYVLSLLGAKADDSDVVHLAGAETITGTKTFTGTVSTATSTGFLVRHDLVDRGTAPSANVYWQMSLCDASTAEWSSSGLHGRLGMLELMLTSSNVVNFGLHAYRNVAGSSDVASLRVVMPDSGDPYATAPSTSSDRSTGTDIVTRNWLPKDTRLVHTSGNEVVSGTKTFTNVPQVQGTIPAFVLRNTSADRATPPTGTTNYVYDITMVDSAGSATTDRYGLIECRVASDYTQMTLATYNSTSTNDICRIDIIVGTTLGYRLSTPTVVPRANDTWNLGLSLLRWKDVYAINTTIGTSDRRLKTGISDIPDAVLDAWSGISWIRYKFIDAVEKKGQDARFHTGAVAQDMEDAFRSAGLDARAYGFFCYDEWGDVAPSYDEDGNVSFEGQKAGDMYSLRYAEALCMEAAYMRRENARLKKRVADLEERLAALELKVS